MFVGDDYNCHLNVFGFSFAQSEPVDQYLFLRPAANLFATGCLLFTVQADYFLSIANHPLITKCREFSISVTAEIVSA